MKRRLEEKIFISIYNNNKKEGGNMATLTNKLINFYTNVKVERTTLKTANTK